MQWKNPDGSLTGGVVIEDGAGNKLGTAANPLNVAGGGGGGGGGSNYSVSSTGVSAPTSATAIGFQNASGNLALPTPSAGLPVADSGAAITGAAIPAGGVGLTGWLSAIWVKLSGTLSVSWSGQSVAVSNFPSSQTVAGSVAITGNPVLGAGSATIGGVNVLNGGAAITSGNPLQVAGAFSASVSATYNLTPPTLTSGSTTGLQVDQNGNLKIAGSFSGSTSVTYNTTPPTLTSGATAPLQGDASGNLKVNIAASSATLGVSWTGQSVSVSALPALPTGANTIGAISNTAFIANAGTNLNTSALALETGGNLAAIKTALGSPLQAGGAVSVSNFPGTQAVSASALPLPAGAATAALQSSLITLMGAAPAQDGTDATGVTAPTGGVGIRGWLSGNYAKLTAIAASLAGTLTTALAAGSNVIGYAGSLNFQTAPVVPTIQAAAYASGNVIGGKQTVSVFRNTTQPSATLSQFLLGWAGAETVAVAVYLFSRNPTNSTITDKAAFVLAAADAQYLACAPFTLTAAASAGSTQTFAAQSLSLSVKNLDSSVTQNLYAVLVVGGAVTPAVGDLFFSISGVLD